MRRHMIFFWACSSFSKNYVLIYLFLSFFFMHDLTHFQLLYWARIRQHRCILVSEKEQLQKLTAFLFSTLYGFPLSLFFCSQLTLSHKTLVFSHSRSHSLCFRFTGKESAVDEQHYSCPWINTRSAGIIKSCRRFIPKRSSNCSEMQRLHLFKTQGRIKDEQVKS